MNNEHGIKITERDRVMKAWQDSMELVRDFKLYAKEVEGDKKLFKIFEEFAEDEGVHAATFLEILHDFDRKMANGDNL